MTNQIYLFAGDSYMVKARLNELKQSLGIQHEQLNITTFKEMPNADVLTGACAEVPFMEDHRLIIVQDSRVLTAKGNAAEGKNIAAYIENMPDSTVLVFCLGEGAPDKRRVLYKQIKKLGHIQEYSAPDLKQCAAFVKKRAKQEGADIQQNAAEVLVQLVGCDYYALSNETAKLAVYSGGKSITPQHVKKCASRSLEYNVFEIHTFFVNKQAAKAQALLADIMNEERPEALIGLFARKIRDMYKTKSMQDAGFSTSRMTQMLKVPGFVTRRLAEECRRFSAAELRTGLTALADVDFAVKSGRKDASLALADILVKIYKL